MAVKTYYVEPSRLLRHDEVDYPGGEPVKLDEDVAKPLLEAGIVLKDDPKPKPAKE